MKKNLPSDALSAAKSSNRTKEAYRILREEIMKNRMPPGFQILETDLAERLGISRTPVREAVIRLCEDGLVEVQPRRGVRVRPISTDDMREIYELLIVLEAECARSLTERGLSPSQIKQLERSVSEMETALCHDKLDVWARADDRFHRLHQEFVTNRRLAKMLGQLLDQSHRARMFTLHIRQKPLRSTSDHRSMIEALQKSTAKSVSTLYRDHRRLASIELLDILGKFQLNHF